MYEVEQMFQFFYVARTGVAIGLLVLFLILFYNLVVKRYKDNVEQLFDNATEDMDYDRMQRIKREGDK